ncbi:MAG: hypothetical protein IT211_11175 [Armatimonadetes bacterium]|nr:hypothetical protein [Armatimonadota bacterium]
MDLISLHMMILMLLAMPSDEFPQGMTMHNFSLLDTAQFTPIVVADLKIQLQLSALAEQLPERPKQALLEIEGTGRRLLALRYYLGREGDLKSEWTWTRAQFEQFKRTTSYRHAIAEVELVKAKFAELNPGYTLGTTLQARPIEEQLDSWNSVPSVAVAANALRQQLRQSLLDSNITFPADSLDLEPFCQTLRTAQLPVVPTVAVPGLSQHGQLRAFDFVVKQEGRVIAGTNAGSARSQWDKPGWTKKLQEAINAASRSFSGPLRSPYEPWHYTYRR